MATVKKTPPVDSKGNPKKYAPMLDGPLARGIANLSNRISENSSKIMEQSRQIELGKERAAKLAELKKKYPAPAYKGTFAPLKPMSFISQPAAPKAAPAARPVAKTAVRPAAPVAKTTPRPAAPVAKTTPRPAAPVAKAAPKASAPVARTAAPIKPMASLSVSASETQPMAKREVDLNISTKRGNLFQRMGERMKQRQLARANRSVGTPMKSTSSVPSTPTPSAPQREMNATDRLKMALQAKSAPQREMNSTDKLKMALQAQKSQPLSAAAKGMLDKYMSKKYMGGGKMEYGMGGKMDKKKAFMEMIAKLKAKKK
jgi:hypothetical protein